MGLTHLALGQVYDGKKLWEVYMSWGAASTHSKLREWAVSQGMVNPLTGKVSQMGAFYSMWRWAVRNPKEAYPHWQKWISEYMGALVTTGFLPTYENFLRDLKKHAKNPSVVSRPQYHKFCEENNLTP